MHAADAKSASAARRLHSDSAASSAAGEGLPAVLEAAIAAFERIKASI